MSGYNEYYKVFSSSWRYEDWLKGKYQLRIGLVRKNSKIEYEIWNRITLVDFLNKNGKRNMNLYKSIRLYDLPNKNFIVELLPNTFDWK